MPSELKPCPFCGCLASIHEDRRCFPSGPGWRIECEGRCHGMTCWWHTKQEAIEFWNTRAPEPTSAEWAELYLAANAIKGTSEILDAAPALGEIERLCGAAVAIGGLSARTLKSPEPTIRNSRTVQAEPHPDTERLDWLEHTGTVEIECTIGDTYCINPQNDESDEYYDTLREAIDAARKASEPGEI